MSVKLKPCPFCGSDDISAFTLAPQSFVYCRICKAHIGPYLSHELAAVAWNRRTEVKNSG